MKESFSEDLKRFLRDNPILGPQSLILGSISRISQKLPSSQQQNVIISRNSIRNTSQKNCDFTRHAVKDESPAVQPAELQYFYSMQLVVLWTAAVPPHCHSQQETKQQATCSFLACCKLRAAAAAAVLVASRSASSARASAAVRGGALGDVAYKEAKNFDPVA